MIERASANDLMQRAADVGPLPGHIAAVLVLDAPFETSAVNVAWELGLRLAGLPRLRQCLRPAPLGCGRPYWTDAARFDLRRHVRVVRTAPPGDEAALLEVTLGAVRRPAAPNRPPWSLTVVDGLASGQLAVVVVVDHVLSDGVSGLALLRALAGPAPDTIPPPRPSPTTTELARDAWQRRARTLREVPDNMQRAVAAARELRSAPLPRAPATSLNRPTGAGRALALARTDLRQLRAAAHACDATVNDVLLTAVLTTLGELIRERGEEVSQLCLSVPVSQGKGDGGALGNRVGVMPMLLPVPQPGQDLTAALRAVARATRQRKASGMGASSIVVEPTFRLLRSLGVLGWFMDRQRMINTVVSNVPGPREPLELLGMPVRQLLPVSGIYGNVPIGFTALSYLDELVVTVMVDPAAAPPAETVAAAMERCFAAIALPTSEAPAPPQPGR